MLELEARAAGLVGILAGGRRGVEDTEGRVIRGAGWAQSRREMIETGYRGAYLTAARGSAVGFRCAAAPAAENGGETEP